MTNPLQIYSGSNVLLYTTPINVGCRRRVQLMNEDSITVKFSDKTKMKFPVGTRIGDFYITKEQQEKYNATTGGYDYELKFDAYYWLWANRLLFYVMPGVTNAPKETSFKLTATIDVHAAVILRCLSALGFTYGGSPFRVDTDAGFSTEAKYISYANMSVLGGIQAIADAYECEWWVVGNAIHFGKCNAIGEYDFTVGENVASITSDSKETAPNRLIVFGSTRNLPPNYRSAGASDTTDAIVVKRLMLPAGTPYLQTSPNIPEDEIVEKEITLDSIYPRTALTISEVVTYDSTAQDGTTQTFYRVKYGASFLFSKDYILPDEELHVVFESGNLHGMDFAVKFNPLGVGEKNDDDSFNPEAQMFEIVVNEDYGRALPDVVLHPEVGDKFSLYGWDSTKMEDLGLLAEAEQELLTEGNKLLDEYRKDKQTYTCPMMWDWCKEQAEKGNSPRLGSVVNLHFVAGDAGRVSRIIGYEHDLDIEYSDVTYICGEKVSVSRLKTLESKVEGISKDESKVKVQNSLDFLSKRYADMTPYLLTLGDGLHIGDFVRSLLAGKGAGCDKLGNAQFESVEVRSYLRVLELIINRQRIMDADELLTEGDTIERVVDNGDGTYGLYLRDKWDGYITAQAEGNVIRGVINTLAAGSGTYYTSWVRVNSVNQADNYLNVTMYPDNEVPAGKNFPPCEKMVIQRWGNQTDETRQECIYLSSTEGRIMMLTGVTKPILEEYNYAFCLGKPLEFLADKGLPLIEGESYIYVRGLISRDIIYYDKQGKPIPNYVDRGQWDATADYYCNATNPTTGVFETSEVWYKGCKYRCMSTGTHDTPGWASTAWMMIEGNPNFTIDFAEHELYWRGDSFNATLTLVAMMYNNDITAKVQGVNVAWTRESYDAAGNRRVASDNAWKPTTDSDNKRLILTIADLDWDGKEGSISKTIFCCTATIDDSNVATAEMNYEF